MLRRIAHRSEKRKPFLPGSDHRRDIELGVHRVRPELLHRLPHGLHALPQIFTGIATANGYAFTTLVMAEMMGQPGGLGYYINASKVWSAYYKVFAAIIVMAILFSIITWLLEFVEARALKWQKGVIR